MKFELQRKDKLMMRPNYFDTAEKVISFVLNEFKPNKHELDELMSYLKYSEEGSHRTFPKYTIFHR
jgi:hypothetical protein